MNTQPLRQAVAKHKAESPPREASTVTLCPCSHSKFKEIDFLTFVLQFHVLSKPSSV